MVSLDNGCACCTVRGDLVKALVNLKDRRKDFDLVLLETTGMANPAPVVSTFVQDARVANNFRVDGIVCLVDCKHVRAHLEEVKADDAVNEAVCQGERCRGCCWRTRCCWHIQPREGEEEVEKWAGSHRTWCTWCTCVSPACSHPRARLTHPCARPPALPLHSRILRPHSAQ